MNDYGFCKVAAAIPKVKVADCKFNTEQIKKMIFQAEEQGVQIVCFPELSISSYTCGDLFLQKTLIRESENNIARLLEETKKLSICFIVGAPVEQNSKLYNCAIVCRKGKVLGIVPKIFLPNYSEFYEKRWFEPYLSHDVMKIAYAGEDTCFGTNILFGSGIRTFAVEVCEDLWSVIPPGSHHAIAGARLIFNLSASDELIGKREYVKSLISQQSARCLSAYVYAGAGFGESSTDLVYTGNAYIYENGKLLSESKRFQLEDQLIVNEIDFDLLNSERRKNTTFSNETNPNNYVLVPIDLNNQKEWTRLTRKVNPTPFIPASNNYHESCEEIFSIQVAGLAKRILHTNSKSLVIGVSGGLDSTLALLVCVKTADKLNLPRKTILGVTLPGFGTTDRTYNNATKLMKSLGISRKEISIVAAGEQHFKDIGHDPAIHDVTYENTQARERTQILMDLANKENGMVIGTGDMSELALGWATYNGDHMSMYGVNS
ncbi:MAG: NAD(+) synthase, partial [Dysgonamonadaceae bacterium]|nr:NAD(+) synthase [Dysgonamonadaceae bacterium]